MRDLEWSDVRLFLAIAREGTLGAAARNVGLTQPTMGRRLKALEASVGHLLFQRTTNGFVLTDEVTVVMTYAERMEEETSAMLRQLSGTEQQLDGMLRISCSDWFGVHILTPLLTRFSQRYPNIVVELLTDSRLLNLSRREADLVFRIQPFTEPDVVSRKLVDIGYGLYASEGYPDIICNSAAKVSVVTMDEAFADMPDVAWLRETLPNARIVMRSNSRDVQAGLCTGGAGLAVLPRPLGDRLDGLRRLRPPTPPPSRATWVGYHRDLRRLPRLRALLDLVADEIDGVVIADDDT